MSGFCLSCAVFDGPLEPLNTLGHRRYEAQPLPYSPLNHHDAVSRARHTPPLCCTGVRHSRLCHAECSAPDGAAPGHSGWHADHKVRLLPASCLPQHCIKWVSHAGASEGAHKRKHIKLDACNKALSRNVGEPSAWDREVESTAVRISIHHKEATGHVRLRS